jgi:Spy/CpxP family protein refolding chaperone
MKPRIRLVHVLASALLAAATAGAAAAQSAPAPSTPPMHLGGFGRCLALLNLSQSQQDAIQQFLAAEKPTLTALHGQIKADAQTLKADSTAASPNAATIGADYLKVTADRQAMAAERQKILDTISGQLNQSQSATFQACMASAFRGHRGSW